MESQWKFSIKSSEWFESWIIKAVLEIISSLSKFTSYQRFFNHSPVSTLYRTDRRSKHTLSISIVYYGRSRATLTVTRIPLIILYFASHLKLTTAIFLINRPLPQNPFGIFSLLLHIIIMRMLFSKLKYGLHGFPLQKLRQHEFPSPCPLTKAHTGIRGELLFYSNSFYGHKYLYSIYKSIKMIMNIESGSIAYNKQFRP